MKTLPKFWFLVCAQQGLIVFFIDLGTQSPKYNTINMVPCRYTLNWCNTLENDDMKYKTYYIYVYKVFGCTCIILFLN